VVAIDTGVVLYGLLGSIVLALSLYWLYRYQPAGITAVGRLARAALERIGLLGRSRAGCMDEQTAVLSLSQSLLAETDLQAMMERAVRAAAEALGTEFAMLGLIEADGATFSNRAAVGWPPDILEQAQRIPLDAHTGLAHAIRNRTPVRIADMTREAGVYTPPWATRLGIVSTLIVPMLVAGRAVGGLVVNSGTRRHWKDDEVRLLSLLAATTAQALERARLLEQERRARRRAETLLAATQALGASLDSQQVLEQILFQLRKVVPFDRASVQILKDHTLVITGGYGFPNLDDVLGVTFNLEAEHGPNREVIETRAPVIVPDLASKYGDFCRQPNAGSSPTSWLGVPLLFRDQVMGIIALNKTEPDFYGEEDARLASAFAAQAAVAIENARLYEETRRHTAELAALHDLTLAITSSLDLQDVLQMAVQHILHLLDAEGVGIFLLGDDGVLNPGAVHIPASSPADVELLTSAVSGWQDLLPDGASFHALNVSELPDAFPLTETFQRAGIRTVGLSRLTHRDLPIGMLVVLYHDSIQTEAHRLVQTIAQVISPTIAHALRFGLTNEELRQANQRLAVANEISRRLSSILDVDRLLSEVVELLRNTLGYYHAAVALIEDDEVVYHAAAGDPPIPPGLRLKVGKEGITGWVAGSGEPLYVPDVSKDQRYVHDPHVPRTRSELAVPIRLGDRTLGVLDVEGDQPDAFDHGDVAVLQAIADQLALALENARAYQEAQAQRDEARAMAEVLARTNAELAQAMQAKSEFMNRISHELRTPLQAVLGFADLMAKERAGPLTEKQRRYLGHVLESGKHLLALVNDMLDLAKAEAGKMEMVPERVEVAEACDSVMSIIRARAEEKGVDLRIEVCDSDLTVVADATRLRQILLNLLDNAVKFTPEGGQVVLRAERVADFRAPGSDEAQPVVLFSVADTGIGIKEEDFPKVFGQFEQIGDPLTRAAGGTGLGLALTKRLVELQDGHIWFESTYGEGTTFYVALPAEGRIPSLRRQG